MVPIVRGAGWVPGLVWTGAENAAPLGIVFCFLCTLFVLLCPDCPFCMTTHTTQTSMQALDGSATGIGGIRSPDRPARGESLYRPFLFSPCNSSVLCPDCPGFLPIVLTVQHKHPWPRRESNPQPQQEIGRRPLGHWDRPEGALLQTTPKLVILTLYAPVPM